MRCIGDRVCPRCHGRYLASHLPNARYVEQPGDHLLWMGDTDALFAEIDDFIGGAEHRPPAAHSGPTKSVGRRAG